MTLIHEFLGEPPYLSGAEAAKLLGITKEDLKSRTRAGSIPEARRDPVWGYRYYTYEDVQLLKDLNVGLWARNEDKGLAKSMSRKGQV